MSLYRDILERVKETLAGLGPGAVKIRKLPRADEEIDELPIVIVAAREPEQVGHVSFEQLVNVVYTVDVVYIGAGGVQALAEVDDALAWRESVRRAFQAPLLSGVAQVSRAEIEPGPAFERQAINHNYDYSGMRLRFHAVEPRDN